ncbi:oxidative stress-induced growth inhibitor 1-like isoform X2 [Lycorma delicatula]|uniref:oxidative stress-induced growth inhibitor 1-like isoform X2 n=1 Tax=Lycorma delicatula TaxID=130591 RepID=UPI003F5179D5
MFICRSDLTTVDKMRDYTNSLKGLPPHTIYKEVVVIGNGPSGLALSYLLDGNLPYYNGNSHPDEMLLARLKSIPASRSLVHQDLEYLSQGLEGRANNPVSLLMDALCHPCADQGIDLPSLIDWRYEPDQRIDHVVLGKGLPGGAWQTMDSNVLTISLNTWMELPGLTWFEWESKFRGVANPNARRVSVAEVAAYYSDYLRINNISRHFRSGVVVTAVHQLDGKSLEGVADELRSVQWNVEGFDLSTGESFSYICQKIVLATGSTDLPNRLSVPGERNYPDWVFHDLVSFEHAIDVLAKENPDIHEGVRSVDPVVIIGAGLSAADAVLSARFRSLPVVHIFRRPGITPDRMLPENMYPEYHKVHQMMTDRSGGYPDYTAYPEHKVVGISSFNERKIQLTSPDGQEIVHKVSLIAILIGSRPDLSYLPPEFQDGEKLGVIPDQPIDCRANPLSIDPWSHSLRCSPLGMYAVGPISGDNFVRFLIGGVLAVVHDIHRQKKLLECT